MMRRPRVPLRPAPPRAAHGFTLVELMLVISIITLLASIVLVAMAGVQEQARADRTRAQIARIDALISERWEQYRWRRVPVPLQMRFPQGQAHIGARRPDTKVMLDAYRVDALRELMRMELPDRKTDLLMGPQRLPAPPGLWRAYRRHAATLISQRRPDVAIPTNEKSIDKHLDQLWSSDFESAECLYLILAQMNDQGAKALEYFSAQEIGDIDNDGMLEIHDGWGRPIIFLRWAPGLNVPPDMNNIIAGSPQDGHSPDPFDLQQIYPRLHNAPTFALYPLIASSGPDRQMEIFADNPNERNRINYALTTPPNNPFVGHPAVSLYQSQTTVMVGSPQDSNGDGILGWLDNITNHNLTGS